MVEQTQRWLRGDGKGQSQATQSRFETRRAYFYITESLAPTAGAIPQTFRIAMPAEVRFEVFG